MDHVRRYLRLRLVHSGTDCHDRFVPWYQYPVDGETTTGEQTCVCRLPQANEIADLDCLAPGKSAIGINTCTYRE